METLTLAADGKLTQDELPDFLEIHEKLKKVSLTVDGMMMWFENAIANGDVTVED